MKLKGNINELRNQIFREKTRKRKLPFALKIKELEEVSAIIDEKEWKKDE